MKYYQFTIFRTVIIKRNILAILLETRPNNIKKIEQTENDIYIQLRDEEDRLSMTIGEYQNCLQQLKGNQYKIDRQNLVTLAIILSVFVGVSLASVNTSLISNENSQSNPQLTVDR